MTPDLEIEAHSWSSADDLGYLGQQAVAEAAQTADYRIVGGHMVRLLLLAHPAERAVQRTTIDADAAVSDVDVVGSIVNRLKGQNFVQERGNVYTKAVDERQVEINLLLSRTGSTTGTSRTCTRSSRSARRTPTSHGGWERLRCGESG